MSPSLTHDTVLALLSYDPVVGVLRWRARPASLFPSTQGAEYWNATYAHQIAGSPPRVGRYSRITIFNHHYRTHHVIWFYMTGAWPEDLIDHIDHEPSNNRWDNLRLASHATNARNRSMQHNNASGVNGIDWYARDSLWRVRVKPADGPQKHIGYFPTLLDAVAARIRALKPLDYHPNHGR